MGMFRVPPGARSRAHYHDNCESALYMLNGGIRIKWGDHLEKQVEIEPGDMLDVLPRITHIVENVSDTEPAEYVVARDSPQEDAVVVPGPRSASDGSFTGERGLKIAWRSWLPDGDPRAVVVIAHGPASTSGATSTLPRGSCPSGTPSTDSTTVATATPRGIGPGRPARVHGLRP